QDMTAFLNCLSEDVIHDINQGASQIGKEAFAKFIDHYKEKVVDLVIMVSDDGILAQGDGNKPMLVVAELSQQAIDRVRKEGDLHNFEDIKNCISALSKKF